MPDLFEKNPVTKTMYDKISKKKKNELMEVIKQAGKNNKNNGASVPGLDEMTGKLENLTNQMETYKNTLNGVQSMGDQMVSSLDSQISAAGDEEFLKLYDSLMENNEQNISDMRQKAHDLLVKKQFLALRFEGNDTDGSKFADWYYENVSSQYDQILNNLLKKQKQRENQLDEEIKLKKNLLNNQSKIERSSTKVFGVNDEEIAQDAKKLETAKGNLLVSQRNAEFDIEEVKLTNIWTNRMYNLFVFLSISLIVVGVISSFLTKQ